MPLCITHPKRKNQIERTFVMRFLTCVLLSAAMGLSAAALAADKKADTKKNEKPAVETKKEAKAEVKPEIKMAEADPEAMVVKINNTVIKEKTVADETAKRLEVQKKRMPQGMEINDWMRNQVRGSVVEMLVERELLNQKLAEKKIEVTDEDVMKEIETIAKAQNLTMEQVPAEIEKFGMTMDDLKSQIRMKVQMDKLVAAEMKDGKVTDEDVKKFYDDNPQYFEKPEQVQASHILVKVEKDASDADKAAAKTKIEGLLKQVKEGGDFAELAKANSDCPSKERGGDLGMFGRGQMVKEFEDAAFGMEVGQVSDVVETQFGYHIIKKTGAAAAKKDALEDVAPRIRQHLEQQKRNEFWQSYNKQLHDNAKIEYSESEKALREQNAQPRMPMPPAQPQPEHQHDENCQH